MQNGVWGISACRLSTVLWKRGWALRQTGHEVKRRGWVVCKWARQEKQSRGELIKIIVVYFMDEGKRMM